MAKKTDPAHEETEQVLKEVEQRIKKEYQQAVSEIQDKMDDYMSRFRLKDQKWREWVDDGTKTMQEYNEWRYGQIAVGQRWEAMKDTIAHDIHNTNMIAKSITQGYMPEVYANNFNYGTYEAEVGAHVDTSFTLYDRQSVERIMRDDPDLLPPPGKKTSARIAEGKDIRWNKQQIQSVMTQGILQGDSIPKLSKRLAVTVGEKNYKSAIRNARTMTTGAQNAGRMDSYKRAESMGIDMEVEWIATLDGRTRHEHRMLDGQRRPVGKPFEVEGVKIQYAGDPHAPGNMIYNCRCTLAGHVKGFDAAEVDRDTSAIGDMTYDEWKKSKDIKHNPIDLQEQKGKSIAQKYKEEYRQSYKLQSKYTDDKIKSDDKPFGRHVRFATGGMDSKEYAWQKSLTPEYYNNIPVPDSVISALMEYVPYDTPKGKILSKEVGDYRYIFEYMGNKLVRVLRKEKIKDTNTGLMGRIPYDPGKRT